MNDCSFFTLTKHQLKVQAKSWQLWEKHCEVFGHEEIIQWDTNTDRQLCFRLKSDSVTSAMSQA